MKGKVKVVVGVGGHISRQSYNMNAVEEMARKGDCRAKSKAGSAEAASTLNNGPPFHNTPFDKLHPIPVPHLKS